MMVVRDCYDEAAMRQAIARFDDEWGGVFVDHELAEAMADAATAPQRERWYTADEIEAILLD